MAATSCHRSALGMEGGVRWSLGLGGDQLDTHTHTPCTPSALTFRWASPLLQGQDGLGGDKEGQRARLEEGQPGGGGTRGDACAHGLGTGSGEDPPLGPWLYLMPTVVWMRVVMPTQVKMVPMR